MNRQHSLKTALLLTFAALLLIGGQLFHALPSCNTRPAMCFDFGAYAYAPYHYRVLSYALEGMPQSVTPSLFVNDVLIHSAAIVLILVGLYIWLKRWSGANGALLGILLLTANWMFAYNYYQRDKATAIELACVVWFLVAMDYRRILPSVAILILASLNRETGFLLAALWALYHLPCWRERRYWVNGAALLLAYGAVYLSLRMALGNADHILGFDGTLAYNLDNIPNALLINLILAPFWILGILSTRHAPAPLRNMALILLLYVPMVALGGGWIETPRLLMPMFPVILPGIVYGIIGTLDRHIPSKVVK